jgi:hypothetical protein
VAASERTNIFWERKHIPCSHFARHNTFYLFRNGTLWKITTLWIRLADCSSWRRPSHHDNDWRTVLLMVWNQFNTKRQWQTYLAFSLWTLDWRIYSV